MRAEIASRATINSSSVAVSKSNCISISAAAVGTTIAASKSAAIRQKRMYTFLALFSPGPEIQPALYYTVFHAFMQEFRAFFPKKTLSRLACPIAYWQSARLLW